MDITSEEFQIMVDQLLYQEPVSFEMLCVLAERTLKKYVSDWCWADSRLRNRGCEDDILQEICIRLIHTTVDYYLLRDGLQTPRNRDPLGFQKWMCRVGKNVKNDYARRLGQTDSKTLAYEDTLLSDWAFEEEAQEDIPGKLQRAVQIVLDADAGVYKTLTWLAQVILITQLDITKIDSNDRIVECFAHKTLNEMYEILAEAAKRISWLRLTDAQNAKITEALNRPWNECLKYGEVEYGAFFMKKGGKKSISDWVNRMNNVVRRAMDDGTSANG